jgi:DnaJ-class molecular chaperone
MTREHYATLGLREDATQEDVRAAYKRAAQRTHPDKPGGDTKEFRKVKHAYAILVSPHRRAQYDADGTENSADDMPEEQQVFLEVAGLMCTLVEECPDVTAHDLFERARELIRQQCKNIDAGNAAIRAKAAKFRAAAKRVRYTTAGKNQIAEFFEAQANNTESPSIERNEKLRERCVKIMEFLDGYSYATGEGLDEMLARFATRGEAVRVQ